jgi:hypothetical protein
MRPMLTAEIKYFGRHRNDMIRDASCGRWHRSFERAGAVAAGS